MLRDAADAMHVNADDLANLMLRHSGERELHYHHVTQQVFDCLLLFPFRHIHSCRF
jgi:hypothetical protein